MKKVFVVIALCLGPLLHSCQPYQDAPEENRYLEGVHQTVDLNIDELYDSFGVEDYPEITSKLEYIITCRSFRAVVITYHTTDPLGNPVVADGTLYYPLDRDIKGVVEMSGIAHMNKNGGSSEDIPVLDMNSAVDGWVPSMPIYIFHRTEDLYVPVEAAEYAYTTFKKNGAYVQYQSGPGTHADWGVKAFGPLLLYLAVQ